MEVTVDYLFTMIGKKVVEIEMLRDQNHDLLVKLRRLQAGNEEDDSGPDSREV